MQFINFAWTCDSWLHLPLILYLHNERQHLGDPFYP